ncbi:MAG: acylphosphatase [Bdellovibrionales bacterium]|nr:acylphosphatase [Bdellovibrionales bacterium]
MENNASAKNKELVRALVLIAGRVQGVGFRYWTRSQAEELGVVGYVKNLNDGRVEACFEGERGEVEKLLDRAKQGPTFAKVEDLEVSWGEYSGDSKDFEIQR